MTLLEGWQIILKSSWAVKLAGSAALFQGLLTIVSAIGEVAPSPWWTLLTAVLTALSILARLVPQPKMHEALEKAKKE